MRDARTERRRPVRAENIYYRVLQDSVLKISLHFYDACESSHDSVPTSLTDGIRMNSLVHHLCQLESSSARVARRCPFESDSPEGLIFPEQRVDDILCLLHSAGGNVPVEVIDGLVEKLCIRDILGGNG